MTSAVHLYHDMFFLHIICTMFFFVQLHWLLKKQIRCCYPRDRTSCGHGKTASNGEQTRVMRAGQVILAKASLTPLRMSSLLTRKVPASFRRLFRQGSSSTSRCLVHLQIAIRTSRDFSTLAKVCSTRCILDAARTLRSVRLQLLLEYLLFRLQRWRIKAMTTKL